MSDNGKVYWKQILAILSILVASGGVIAAHFNGVGSAVAQSMSYTDKRFDELTKRLDRMEDKILDAIKKK